MATIPRVFDVACALLLGCSTEVPSLAGSGEGSGIATLDPDPSSSSSGGELGDTTATSSTTMQSDGHDSSGTSDDSSGDVESSSGHADDGSGSSSTGAAILPCDIASVTLEPIPPNIMLVLDTSGSMSLEWDHDADPNTLPISRWNSLHQVVESVVTTFDAEANFGATLFPSAGAGDGVASSCMTSAMSEVAVAPMNLAAILAGIPPADPGPFYGGTPATAGVMLGRDHLLALDPASPRALVLVTDGAANCSVGAVDVPDLVLYDDQLPVVVGAAWTDLGIPTYVVGIDASDVITEIGISTIAALDDVAVAGGKPLAGPHQFYQTTDQTELQDALQQIVDDAVGCTLPLDPTPAFPELLEVYVDGVEVPPVTGCDEDGWMFGEPPGSYDTIVLCGTWCTDLSIASDVAAEYYCRAG